MGQNILITGASEGIGREMSKLLAKYDHNLYLLARTEERLSELKKETKEHKGEIHFIKCDVTDFNQCKAAFDIAKGEFGSIDIAILNAGISENIPLSESHLKSVRKTFEVNFFGIANFTEILLPYFKKQGKGKLVGISSMAEIRGFEKYGPYCASKSAVTIFLESARIEMKRHGVDVVTVRPGFVDTYSIKENDFHMPFIMQSEEAAKRIIKAIFKNKKRFTFPVETRVISEFLRIIPNSLYEFFASMKKV